MALNMKHMGLIPSNLCSPFIDPTDSIVSTKITIFSVAISQAVALILISITYFQLLKYLKEYYQRNITSSKDAISKSMILQLIIIIASNLVCWIPSSIIYLSTLFLSQYSADLLMWTTIAIVPINSIINPILFLVVSTRN